MTKFQAWVEAFRLRTLALSLSAIGMGSAVASACGLFRTEVWIWAMLTTLFLQILSNLSNDYGDAVSGADHAGRVGPDRMVQTGRITPGEMKRMMGVFALLSLICGIALLAVAFDSLNVPLMLFFLLGLGAIAAAIYYTVGKNPYGYRGMGDLFVFLFFGIVGVGGTFYLHTQTLWFPALLPAVSVGALSAGVLNVNNLRDVQSDRRAGKHTLVVRYGVRWGKKYQFALLGLALAGMVSFSALRNQSVLEWIYVAAFPLLALHAQKISATTENSHFDPQLKFLSLTTLVLTILFAAGIWLSK